jgi:hypothetical protein
LRRAGVGRREVGDLLLLTREGSDPLSEGLARALVLIGISLYTPHPEEDL